MKETWFDSGLKVWGALCLVLPLILWFVNRGRKQATVGISKTEGEVYKNLVENKLADLNISEIIDNKVDLAIKKFKDMLWDQQQEHYKIKLEAQERMIKVLKEKNEIEQENELLKNELHEIREENQSCFRQIELLRKEVAELRNQQS